MLTAHEVLVRTKALLSDKAKWTQNSYARTKTGKRTYWDSRYATCWCSTGAINLIQHQNRSYSSGAREFLQSAANLIRHTDIFSINDTGTHEDVMKMFDIAIEKSKPS